MNPPEQSRRKTVRTLVAGLVLGGLLASAIPFVSGQTGRKPAGADQEEISLVSELREREKALAAKEKELVQKEEELNLLQGETDAKLTRLIALQGELKITLAALTAVKEKQFRDLIKIYTAMSPSKVAPLLNQMADEEALEVLRGLKTDQVAKIMPKLEQDKAVRLSRLLGVL